MDLTFYDLQHLQKMTRQQGSVKYIFDDFVRHVGILLSGWKDNSSESVWIRNAAIEKQIERELTELHKHLLDNIDQNIIDSWNRSNKKTDDLIAGFVKHLAINDNVKQGMFSHNEKAMQVFRNNKIAGKSISSRVWDVTDSAKDNIEYYLSSGLSTGRPSALISQDIRQLLNQPDRRFRRVRNEKGELVYSQPMKEYGPGRGKYRSSYKNALRLASTQTNMAYHLADHERWKDLDFVTGIKIDRSSSAKDECPICDALKGIYPKGFIFTGFHPFCVCQAVPIMLEGEEFSDYLISGRVPQEKIISNIPDSAIEFVKTNKNFAENNIAVKDNSDWFGGGSKVKPGLYEKIADTENSIRMNKAFETAVVFNSKGDILIDKRGAATSVSFTNEEFAMMKDGILTHNHPRGWAYPNRSLGRIGNSFSKEDLQTAVSYDLSEIRAVTPNFTFVMKRPESGWGITREKFSIVFNEEDRKLREEFGFRINNGTLTPTQANTTHFHVLSQRVGKRLGWIYTKAKTR